LISYFDKQFILLRLDISSYSVENVKFELMPFRSNTQHVEMLSVIRIFLGVSLARRELKRFYFSLVSNGFLSVYKAVVPC